MPARTYMVIDRRRDHSFRIPRPDLSRTLGVPNACTSCHQDRSIEWAESVVNEWYGSRVDTERHFGEVFAEARLGAPGSDTALARLTADTSQSSIVRATAASLLSRVLSPASVQALGSSLRDPDPLVRFGGATSLEGIPTSERVRLAFHLLEDTVRTVRITTVRALAAVPAASLGNHGEKTIERVVDQYVRSQLVNAELPESHLNLGTLYVERGDLESAEESYRNAIAIDSGFVPAYVNLSDLYRMQGRVAESGSVLRRALEVAPENPTVRHAVGLLLVRNGNREEALRELRFAAENAPANARFSYVYGVALHSTGRSEDGLKTLERALRSHPYDRELLAALVTINREVGNSDAALGYAQRYAAQWPGDPGVQGLLRELTAERDRP